MKYVFYFSFFFNDTATTEIYTLSLHDALPILASSLLVQPGLGRRSCTTGMWPGLRGANVTEPLRTSTSGAMTFPRTLRLLDRKSTRLNSSHVEISYAVFCLKKKKNTKTIN